jgi:hypothetical protein
MGSKLRVKFGYTIMEFEGDVTGCNGSRRDAMAG